MKAAEVQQAITDRTVEWITKHDDVPWHKPWTVLTGQPRSMSTGKPYRGLNIWVLALTAQDEGYTSPWWGTYNRIAQLSGMVHDPKRHRWVSPDGTPRGVRKGSHGTRVYYWEVKHYPDPTPQDPKHEGTYMFAKVDVVFNADQADGLPEEYYPKPGHDNTELPAPQIVADSYFARGPELRHGGEHAYYEFSDGLDRVTIPDRSTFDSSGDYYWTLFHEATHSTGHPKRLDREGVRDFDHVGSGKYGREELVAQMGAAMLAAMTGIETKSAADNSSAYVGGWLRKIKGDITLIPKAARLAQDAVDYIMMEES